MHVNIKQKANHKVQLQIILPPDFVAYLTQLKSYPNMTIQEKHILAIKQLTKTNLFWTNSDEMVVKWSSRCLLLFLSVLTGNVTTALSLTFNFHSLFLLQQQIHCSDEKHGR